MRVDDNQGGKLHYEPNSYGEWQEQPQYREPLQKLYGDMDRWDFREDDNDYYTQPGKLFRLMSPEQQQVLYENTARNMEGVEEFIKIRHKKSIKRIQLWKGVACLCIPMDKLSLIKLWISS